MKKIVFVLGTLFATCSTTFSQQEFKKAWEAKTLVSRDFTGFNYDLSKVLAGNFSEIEMLDGTTGKSLWTMKFKEKFGVKKVESWEMLKDYENDPIEIVYQKSKEELTTVYLNSKTGEVISEISEKKETISNIHYTKYWVKDYDPKSKTSVYLDAKDRLFKNNKGSDFDATIHASGGYNWTSKVKLKIASHIHRVGLPSGEPNLIMRISVMNDKVFIICEGLTVLDLKTGNLLWTTSFDYTQGGGKSQDIGRAPTPTVTDNAVYICDFTKDDRAIKKLDINTGKILWQSEPLEKSDVVETIFVDNNVVIAKFGGYIRKAKTIATDKGYIYKAKYDYEGTTKVRAYDISGSNTKPIWSDETFAGKDKFSKSESSALFYEHKFACASGQNFYLIEAVTGKVLVQTPLNKTAGAPKEIISHNTNYILRSEKGITSFSAAGKENYTTVTKKALAFERQNEVMYVWTGKDEEEWTDFVRIDLATGKLEGKLADCEYPYFDETGNYFLKFKKNTITKYNTKP